MATEPSHIVTAEHLVEFDQYMREWQAVLNLQDWRIERSYRRSRAMAEVSFNSGARLAVYKVGKDFGEPVTSRSLKATALHEMLHIFLFDAISDPSEANEHRPINVLEKLLMGALE